MRKEYEDNLKEWLELADDLDDKGCETVKSWDDWSPFGLNESYLRRDMAVHIHLFLEGATRNLGTLDYCAKFERIALGPARTAHGFHHGEDANQGRSTRGCLSTTGQHDRCVEHTVLVDLREVSEKSELVDVGTTPGIWSTNPTMVGLKPLNECPMVRMNGPEVAVTLDLEFLEGIFDGEVDRSLLFRGQDPVLMEQRQLVDEIIKRRSQVMHDVPDANGDLFTETGKVGYVFDIEDVVAALRLELGAEMWLIRFNREKLVDIPLKAIAVVFGPVDLGPATIEGNLVHELDYGREQEIRGQAKDPQGSRDSRPHAGRRDACLQEGGEARRPEGIREPPPSEVASETSPNHRLGGYTAKHTHSGTHEDA